MVQIAVLLAPQDSLNMSQAQWLELMTGLFSNGVDAGQLNTYTTTTTSGLGISVASGKAMIQGFLARSDAAVALTCATADPTNPRIDRAVLHADLTAHTLTVQLLTGTPGVSPSPPALTQTATVWEISVYQIRVNATQTTLTAGSLTDERTYTAPNIAAASITDAQMTNQKVNRTGDTMTGTLTLSGSNGVTANGGNIVAAAFKGPTATDAFFITDSTGGAQLHTYLQAWTGASLLTILGIGTGATGAASWFDNGGVLHLVQLRGPTATDFYIITDTSGGQLHTYFQVYNGASLVTALGLGTGNSGAFGIDNGGKVTAVGTQVTTGFGVPMIVAQAINVLVSSTSLTTILSTTIPATGSYRLNVSFFSGNNVSVNPLIRVTYTGGNMGGSINDCMLSSTGLYLDGTHGVSNGNDLACLAWTNYLKTGTNLSVIYQDSVGTPADRVTAVLERLA